LGAKQPPKIGDFTSKNRAAAAAFRNLSSHKDAEIDRQFSGGLKLEKRTCNSRTCGFHWQKWLFLS